MTTGDDDAAVADVAAATGDDDANDLLLMTNTPCHPLSGDPHSCNF